MNNSIEFNCPELVSEWSEKNAPLMPKDYSYGSNKVVWWKGKCGHEWQTSIKARSSGEGCPICSGARIIEGVNDFASLHPELAKEWSKQNILKPTMVSSGSHKKYYWQGKCGHEWIASIKSRVQGTGCPYCSHNIVLPGFNDLASRFPNIAKEWSDRNLPLTPDKVTAFRNEKVWWKCSFGHEWNTLISTRSSGSKCPYCSGITLLKGFNDLQTRYPKLCAEWSEKNGFQPDTVNEKSTKNVWWKCSLCGNEWKGVIKARVQGQQCPVCAERKVLSGVNDICTTDSALLLEWDYQRNTDISPECLTRFSKRVVWWKDSYGHSWRDKVYNRTVNGEGCKVCDKEFSEYLPILLIMLYAKRYGLKVITQDTNLIGISLDAYIPDLKIAFLFCCKGTNLEKDTITVIEHLCEVRNIQLICVNIKAVRQDILCTIRRGFGKVNIFISSEIDSDLTEARDTFEKLKMMRRKQINPLKKR